MAATIVRHWLKRVQAWLRRGDVPLRRRRPAHRLWLETLENRWAPATVQFPLAAESVLESAGTFTIPVTLSAASTTATSVPFTTTGSALDGADYTGLTASPLIIPAGQLAANITGTLLTPHNGGTTLGLTLTTPTGATLGAQTANTLTIHQQPVFPTTISIANQGTLEPTPHGTVNMNFTVTRTGDLTSQIKVGFTTIAGTGQPSADFTPTIGTATFASGSATATIAIPIFGNGIYDTSSQTFSVQLTGIVDVVGPPVTFAAKTSFAAGTAPVAVAVGDLNGDGLRDLALANANSNNLSVLFNTTAPGATTPSFATQQTFAVGTHPTSVVLADFNGDGRLDLATANDQADTVSVLFNTTTPGSATANFAGRTDFAVGSSPNSVAVGDLNGDGRPDLVATNFSAPFVTYSGVGSVSVLLNTTLPGAVAPTFANHADFAVGSNPNFVAVGDLDGDGQPDLAVANAGSASVSVLLNTTGASATPSFLAHVDFVTGMATRDVAIGDLNGDGLLDLVVTNAGANSVTLIRNTTSAGTASFALQQTVAVGATPAPVTLGDLNGDGRLDLIVGNFSSGSVSVLRNTTPAGATAFSFAAEQSFAAGANPQVLAVADLNGDGLLDVAAATGGANAVSVLFNTTTLGATGISPNFPEVVAPAAGSAPISVAIGDINGDGKPDLATDAFSDNSAAVMLNTTPPGAATPTFAAPQLFAVGTNPLALTMADFNEDGKPDLALVNGGSNNVSVLLNITTAGNAAASFTAHQDFPVGTRPQFVASGDLNGDGKPDLVVANTLSNTVSVLLNTTVPGTTTPAFTADQQFAVGASPSFVAIGDLNGDGRPDLVVADPGTASVSLLVNVMLPGASAPGFAVAQNLSFGIGPFSLALGDLNGDGRLDLAATDGPANNVVAFLNTTIVGSGTISFTAPLTMATGTQPHDVILNDLNGDGRLDLIVANVQSNNVTTFLNTTAAGAAAPSFAGRIDFAVGLRSVFVTAGDLNGDGRIDLATANQTANTVSLLLNTPVTIASDFATGTITEGDMPPTVQFAAASESVNVGAGPASLTLALSIPSVLDTTIPFTVAGSAIVGRDYTGFAPGTLVIPAGQRAATITGTVLSHPPSQGNQTITFTLGMPTNATLGSITTNVLTIVETTPPHPKPGTFNLPIALGTVTDTPQSSSEVLAGSDVQVFSFSAAAGQTLTFALNHPGDVSLDALLRLFDSSGTQLAFNDDGPSPVARFSRDPYLAFTFPSAGTYLFAISGYPNYHYDVVTGGGTVNGSSGGYTLTVDPRPQNADVNNQIREAPSLGATTRVQGISDFAISTPTDVDLFRFTASAGRQLTFSIGRPAGSNLVSVLRLFDAHGRQLAQSRGAGDALLTFRFRTSGVYFIGVSGRGNTTYDPNTGSGARPGSTGSYSLSIAPVPLEDRDHNGRLSLATKLSKPAQPGALSSALDVDIFSYAATSGQRISFTVSGAGGLQPYLRLFDGNGIELAHSTGGRDARLSYEFLISGTYYLGISARGAASYDAVTGAGTTGGAAAGAYVLATRLEGKGPTPLDLVPTIAYSSPGAAVGGVVYFDQNADGLRQSGESGEAAHMVFLDRNNNGIRDDGELATFTNNRGQFLLDGRRPGSVPVFATPLSQFGIPIEKISSPDLGFFSIPLASRRLAVRVSFGMSRYEG